MRKIRVKMLPEAEEVYNLLLLQSGKSKIARSIINAIHEKIELIKIDSHYGNPIAKKLIPFNYKLLYETNNLFRIKLPNYWRMIYTLKNDEIEIIALIIRIMNHKNYNKTFKYKNK